MTTAMRCENGTAPSHRSAIGQRIKRRPRRSREIEHDRPRELGAASLQDAHGKLSLLGCRGQIAAVPRWHLRADPAAATEHPMSGRRARQPAAGATSVPRAHSSSRTRHRTRAREAPVPTPTRLRAGAATHDNQTRKIEPGRHQRRRIWPVRRRDPYDAASFRLQSRERRQRQPQFADAFAFEQHFGQRTARPSATRQCAISSAKPDAMLAGSGAQSPPRQMAGCESKWASAGFKSTVRKQMDRCRIQCQRQASAGRPVPREHRRDIGMGLDAHQRFVERGTVALQMLARSGPFRDDGGEQVERAEVFAAQVRPAGKHVGEHFPMSMQPRAPRRGCAPAPSRRGRRPGTSARDSR